MLKKIISLTMVCLSMVLAMPNAFADSVYNHPLPSLTQPDFVQVQTQLSTAKTLTGNFKQIRDMKLLSQPLVSTGTFILSQANGLIWQQTLPFASTLTVTPDKIIQTIMDTPPTVITKKDQPVVFAFTSVFLSVFQGNTAQIQQYFTIYFQGNTQQWQIALKPKGAPFNKAIDSIEMQGGQYVNTIVVNEAQQNKMTITLTNVKTK